MKTITITAVIVFSALGLAQAQKQEACSGLNWNFRKSDELSWKQSISRNRQISERERARLSKAISQAIDDKNIPPEQFQKIVGESRIRYVDLNGDGQSEVIVQAGSDDYCSPTGNCSFWVLHRVGNEYELLLATEAVQTFTVQMSRSHGFYDLILTQHGSAYESGGYEYRFDAKQYQNVREFTIQWYSSLKKGERHPLRTPIMKDCRQFEDISE